MRFFIPAALNQGPEIRQLLYYIGNYKPKGKGDTYPDHRINKRGMRRILQQYPIKDWTGDIARDFFKKHNPKGETAQCGKDFTGSFRNRMMGKPVTGIAENKSGV